MPMEICTVPQPETLRISKNTALDDPCLAAGDRAYLIGAQHGGFPDIGFHIPNEMGGLWAHPIKLLDGFWLRIDEQWLEAAHPFVSGPFSVTHEYARADGLQITRQQFIPDGEPALVVRWSFKAPVARRLALCILARTELRAVWSLAREERRDHPDQAVYAPELNAWVCQDQQRPWSVVVGALGCQPLSSASGRDLWGPERTAGRGISVAFDVSVDLAAEEEVGLDVIVAGSHLSARDACATFRRVRDGRETMWELKRDRYNTLLNRSTLSIPDHSIQRSWDWLKCNYDWLVREVPGVGRGLGAGFADYPWWFGCDATYALLGALVLGQQPIAVDTLDLLRSVSAAANGDTGRVIHECTTQGEIIHLGCIQETPHFVQAVWQTFRWTGDLSFLERNYSFCKRGLLEWTLGACCSDSDLLPYGFGITERPGLDLQCVDTAAHTVQALSAMAEMAGVLGETRVAEHCRALALDAGARLNQAFWMEDEGLYGDMLATPAEMVPRLRQWLVATQDIYYQAGDAGSTAPYLEALLRQAESAAEPHRKQPWLLKHWSIVAPLESRLAPMDRARRALDRLESEEFTGPHGMFLNGLDRTTSMSINTGALAMAEVRYGRVERGLEYIRLLTDTLDSHLPGAISEVSPDEGCFVQAWSGYAVAWPLVTQVFGVQPDAHRQILDMRPQFPRVWPHAHLDNVHIGDNDFNFHWNGETLHVTARKPGWTIPSSTVPVVEHGF